MTRSDKKLVLQETNSKMILVRFILLFIRAIVAMLWTLTIHIFFIRLRQALTPGKRRIIARPIGVWGRGLAWIRGVRIRRRNERDWPMGDLIVSNHMGFLDIPLLLSFFPAVFVIKIEMRRVFYFGKALELQGHLFVDRDDKKSRQKAGIAVMRLLKGNNRLIVFPEGFASPKAQRPAFQPGSLIAAKRLGKRVELCVIDYLPDRRLLEWDVNGSTFRQLVDLFGRFRTNIGIEFFPSELIEGDPSELTRKYHDIVEKCLNRNDAEREEREGPAQAAASE